MISAGNMSLSMGAYERRFRRAFYADAKQPRYRRIFVYTFCLINICLSLSDEVNKIKTLNIERA